MREPKLTLIEVNQSIKGRKEMNCLQGSNSGMGNVLNRGGQSTGRGKMNFQSNSFPGHTVVNGNSDFESQDITHVI